MEVIIQKDAGAAAELVARIVAKDLQRHPHMVLGLATGRTMEAVYSRLVARYEAGEVDFSLCRTFNLDEYVGLSASHAGSYRHYMDEHLFGRVNIDRRRTHLPDGEAQDLEVECAHYEELIRRYGGIDLQLLGIGYAGHVGFNEPLSALRSRTRVKALSAVTRSQNAEMFGGAEAVPRRAITMGVGTILECRRCILVATGEKKATIVAEAVEGPITAMISATTLQLHPRCTVVVDEAAASKLQGSEYYRWIFANEPEWEEFR